MFKIKGKALRSKFFLFKPYDDTGAPYFDRTLNTHACLVEKISPDERGNKILRWALDKYKTQNMNAADSAGVERSAEQRLAKGVMGILVEGWVRAQLRDFSAKQKTQFIISSAGPGLNASGNFEQVDICIKKRYPEGDNFHDFSRTIEVRSSFNFHSLENAIYGGFSVLGPYSNKVKPGETKKDLYLFVAVDLHQKYADKKYICYTGDDRKHIDYAKTATNIILNHTLDLDSDLAEIRNEFDLALVGGATHDMFEDESLVGTIKNNDGYHNQDFKSISVTKALDAVAVLKRILS
ncbi:hypothetical protein [Comamonas sp. NLF-1-9]|uniref:hypothetical protein n=1 Tax=Comamonas sp. NLF-1-9 TaxID=2853163 RepID=UPI001C47D37E|nr:hypothetical protein [Comamonas sp. NLF-1-9]QXL83191.1 hypothetical protein KUD94_07850 [Comamonas sp. NLF-1-9]